MRSLLGLFLLVSLAFAKLPEKPILMGYYPNWGAYSGFTGEKIRWKMYTHVIYAFYKTDASGDLYNADPQDEPNFRRMVKLAKKNKVKLILSLGGAGQSQGYAEIARDANKTQKFIKQLITLADEDVDGFDIDWEFPHKGDTEPHYNFFKAIRKSIDAYNAKTGKKIEFSSALPCTDWYGQWINPEAIKLLDYANIMTYDYMGTWEKKVKPNSGLDESIKSMKYWYDRGIPKENLVIGFAFYGKSFDGGTHLGSDYDGKGSGNDGFWIWSKMLEQFETAQYEFTYDEETGSEIAVGNEEIIVFNGLPATKARAKWARENKSEYPGVMLWDMLCDFNVPNKQSLLVSLYEELYQEKSPDEYLVPAPK
jgi:chitinase